jgi:hypothetical protein
LLPKINKFQHHRNSIEILTDDGKITINIRQIKTGNKVRKVYIPCEKGMKIYRGIIPYLEKLHIDMYGSDLFSFAFLKGRNCIDHAINHIGFKYTLQVDIKDFFENLKYNHVMGIIDNDILDYTLIDGSFRQGIPTSPIISNIAFGKIDNTINDRLTKEISQPGNNGKFTYSRYADDLCISFNSLNLKDKILETMEHTLHVNGFEINKNKTNLQDYNNGMRIITGVSVGEKNIHVPRRTKRKIRAAWHQRKVRSFTGLCMWSEQINKKSVGLNYGAR